MVGDAVAKLHPADLEVLLALELEPEPVSGSFAGGQRQSG